MRLVAAILCIVVLAICSLGIQDDIQAYHSVSLNVAGLTNDTYRDFIGKLREVVTQGTCRVRCLPVLNPESKVKKVENRFVLTLQHFNSTIYSSAPNKPS
ncbi:hypothetical protein ACSBR1_017881 [Camellia fascicularis]